MKKHFWKLSTILWICIILYLSFFTTVDPNGLPIFENQDKVGHFVFYAILTAVLIKTFSVELIKNPPIVIAIVFAFFLVQSSKFFSIMQLKTGLEVFGI